MLNLESVTTKRALHFISCEHPASAVWAGCTEQQWADERLGDFWRAEGLAQRRLIGCGEQFGPLDTLADHGERENHASSDVVALRHIHERCRIYRQRLLGGGIVAPCFSTEVDRIAAKKAAKIMNLGDEKKHKKIALRAWRA